GRDPAGERRRAGSPRLPHLYLRLDRTPQGGDELPPRHRQPPALDAATLRLDRRGPGAPEDALLLRRLGLGAVLAAARRGAAGDGPPRRAPGPGLPRRDHRARG